MNVASVFSLFLFFCVCASVDYKAILCALQTALFFSCSCSSRCRRLGSPSLVCFHGSGLSAKILYPRRRGELRPLLLVRKQVSVCGLIKKKSRENVPSPDIKKLLLSFATLLLDCCGWRAVLFLLSLSLLVRVLRAKTYTDRQILPLQPLPLSLPPIQASLRVTASPLFFISLFKKKKPAPFSVTYSRTFSFFSITFQVFVVRPLTNLFFSLFYYCGVFCVYICFCVRGSSSTTVREHRHRTPV